MASRQPRPTRTAWHRSSGTLLFPGLFRRRERLVERILWPMSAPLGAGLLRRASFRPKGGTLIRDDFRLDQLSPCVDEACSRAWPWNRSRGRAYPPLPLGTRAGFTLLEEEIDTAFGPS
jgi:hypothetical protein